MSLQQLEEEENYQGLCVMGMQQITDSTVMLKKVNTQKQTLR